MLGNTSPLKNANAQTSAALFLEFVENLKDSKDAIKELREETKKADAAKKEAMHAVGELEQARADLERREKESGSTMEALAAREQATRQGNSDLQDAKAAFEAMSSKHERDRRQADADLAELQKEMKRTQSKQDEREKLLSRREEETAATLRKANELKAEDEAMRAELSRLLGG